MSIHETRRISIRDVNRIMLRRLNSVITNRPDILPDPKGTLQGSPAPMLPNNRIASYLDAVRVPEKRSEELRYYHFLETEIADARRALDAYATMAVTGNLAGGGSDTYRINLVEDESRYPERLVRRFHSLENLMKLNAYAVIRAMAKYGTYTPQNIIGRRDDRRQGVVSLKHIPPATIFRHVDQDGRINDEKFWAQRIDGQQAVFAPRWALPNFSIWSDVVSPTETLLYGTSILKPFGAIGLKVHSMLDASVIARLTRAAARYDHRVDVSDIMKSSNYSDKKKTEAILDRLKQYRKHINRQSVVDDLNKTTFERAKIPEDDFVTPAGKDMGWGVELISGDANVSRVADIELMFRVYFGALGVPPEYLGHERSQGGRSNLSQIDIHFARTVRHIQMFGASGFEHMIFVDMVLGGFDPEQYPIEVQPPRIGARDDLLQAQIRELQAKVIFHLSGSGINIAGNPRWVLKTFLNMSEELEALSDDDLASLFPDHTDSNGGGNGNEMNADQVRRITEDLSARNSELMDQVRNNIRVLAFANEDMDRSHFRYGQPEPGELRHMLNGAA